MQASLATTGSLAEIALALGLGLLVGVQRGWALRNEAEGSRFAGVRTYGLLGLAGGVAGALADRSEALAGIVLGGSAVLILLSYWRMTQLGRSLSGTASIAGLLTLSCGFLAASGERLTATAIAVAMALLLAVLLNTLLKALAAISIAGWKRAWPASAALAASGLACLCALPWVL